MNQDRYYITTSIPYVNGQPHIGFALELIQTDALARYHRLRGDDTRFLTGTDDNALKNVRAAEQAGIPVAELVDRNSERFRDLRSTLNLSWDDFIRTSGEERHHAGTHKLWDACARSGDIYKRKYSGLYCVYCELFYKPEELHNGLCPIHNRPVERVEEENYFFKLSRYAPRLSELLRSGELRVLPETRRNEVLNFIERGLEDFSISRSEQRARGWGIPVPDDPAQVMYVWFDALGNYITALNYGTDGDLFHTYWMENPNRVHVIGKDIIRFHAVYWPAMLLSAGVLLPTTIYVHEFLNVGGERMSKTRGNVIDPSEIVRQFGTDALRYWLLREMPRTEDGDFTLDRLVWRYNNDLANDLGNLLNRTVSMLQRYAGGVVPRPGDATDEDRKLEQVVLAIPEAMSRALDSFDFRAALSAVWGLVTEANGYVEVCAPWVLAKQARSGDEAAAARLGTVLYNLADSLRLIALHLSPFIPDAARRISVQLGIPDTVDSSYPGAVGWGKLAPGTQVAQPEPLFPRLDL